MKLCPILNSDCVESKCMWWTDMVMKNVTTQEVDVKGNCAMSWIPEMLKESNRNTISVAAAVESRGNETIKAHELTNKIFAGMAQLAVGRHEIENGAGAPKELSSADPT